MTPPEVVASIASLTAWASLSVVDGSAVKWRETVQDYIEAQAEEVHKLRNELTAMTLKAERDHEDAMRYRKIRLGRSDFHGDVYATVFAEDGDYPIAELVLDHQVDAMRSSKRAKPLTDARP